MNLPGSLRNSLQAAILMMAMVLATLAATAAAVDPDVQPLPPATQPSTVVTTSPVAADSKATSAAAGSTDIILVEDPSLRIWGFSPRQLLRASIIVIIIFNVVGWSLLIYYIRRAKWKHSAEALAEGKRLPAAKDDTPGK